jgi:UDP-N-acetyl-D-mannosaminuronate dehydrogenase
MQKRLLKSGRFMKKEKNSKSIKLIGILGYGEVGQAIAKFYPKQRLRIRDLKRNDDLKGVEVLHICIPWSKDFIRISKKAVSEAKPKLVIIHSTVPVGTTKKIGGMVVHSPIRGIHPQLYKGVKTFVKYIGADNKKAGELAKKHLEGIGIKTKLFMPSATTEALKIWDTTQYGWMIVLSKEIKKWCDKKGLDFNAVYLEANKTYNEGYKKLGKHEVVRPYLRYMSGKIGGHCIIPNCYLLDSEIAKIILKENNKLK